MRIAFAADHGGAQLKGELLRTLRSIAPEHDFSTSAATAATRPTTIRTSPAGSAGRSSEDDAERGILICGSGVGASVAATRCAASGPSVCHDTYSARQGVEHDDMNVLTWGAGHRRRAGARVLPRVPRRPFSGEPRHVRRLRKVKEIEAGRGLRPLSRRQ